MVATDLGMWFWGRSWRCLEHWSGQPTEYSEFNRLVYEILDDKSGENNTDDRCMVYEVSEGSKNYQVHLYGILNSESAVIVS